MSRTSSQRYNGSVTERQQRPKERGSHNHRPLSARSPHTLAFDAQSARTQTTQWSRASSHATTRTGRSSASLASYLTESSVDTRGTFSTIGVPYWAETPVRSPPQPTGGAKPQPPREKFLLRPSSAFTSATSTASPSTMKHPPLRDMIRATSSLGSRPPPPSTGQDRPRPPTRISEGNSRPLTQSTTPFRRRQTFQIPTNPIEADKGQHQQQRNNSSQQQQRTPRREYEKPWITPKSPRPPPPPSSTASSDHLLYPKQFTNRPFSRINSGLATAAAGYDFFIDSALVNRDTGYLPGRVTYDDIITSNAKCKKTRYEPPLGCPRRLHGLPTPKVSPAPSERGHRAPSPSPFIPKRSPPCGAFPASVSYNAINQDSKLVQKDMYGQPHPEESDRLTLLRHEYTKDNLMKPKSLRLGTAS